LSNGKNWAAVLVLLCGAVSDFLDGYLARKLGLVSRLGEILDPIADKIFINAVAWGTYFFMSLPCPALFAVAVWLTIRDTFLLIAGAYVLRSKSRTFEIRSVFISKLCTALVFVFYGLLFVDVFTKSFNYAYINIFGYFVILLIVATTYVYIARYRRQ
jgi:phosphatidylglycerophosphate synthase